MSVAGPNSDLGPRLSLVRSSLNNGHAATTAACPKSDGSQMADIPASDLAASLASRRRGTAGRAGLQNLGEHRVRLVPSADLLNHLGGDSPDQTRLLMFSVAD